MIEVYLKSDKITNRSKEIYSWLFEHIGTPLKEDTNSINWYYRIENGGLIFSFKDNDAAVLFKLTWS